MLSIRLFGNPEIELDGQTLKISRRKSRAVLYYLAAGGQAVLRERLLNVFWPDAQRAEGRQVLRTTLHGLRQALGKSLVVDDERIGLSEGAWVDVREFMQAAAQVNPVETELRKALDLYRDDFLGDFALPDAPEFEEWQTVTREHLRRLAVQGGMRLSELSQARRDFPAALAAVESVLRLNPLQEDVQREALRLTYLSGDRPGVILRYDKLRRLLDDELGVPPMAETRALYDDILNDRLAEKPLAAPISQPAKANHPLAGETLLPFSGREAELEQLSRAIQHPQLILVEGEAGIGKTRLVDEFLQGAFGIVVRGRGRELEQGLPYQPVIEALRGVTRRPDWKPIVNRVQQLAGVWRAEIVRLLPELAVELQASPATGEAADEARLWEGVYQFMATLASVQPVTFFLDDLHWADHATLGLLGYLVHQTTTERLRFVATLRPPQIAGPNLAQNAAATPAGSAAARTALTALLQTLLREDCLERIRLERLPLQAVQAMARHVLWSHKGGAQGEDARILGEWLYRSSEGNPFVIAEITRAARAEGVIDADGRLDAGRLPDDPVVPEKLYALIQARLGLLSDPARRILDAGVAIGRTFEFEIAAAAAGLSEGAALDACEELAAGRLIHPLDEQRFTFDHSLTMEVAYQEVGELRHRRLHRAVAEAILSLHPDRQADNAALLAHHFDEGQQHARGARYARMAGQQAARLAAWLEAASFFQMALKGLEGRARVDVLIELAGAQVKAGLFLLASQAYQEALNLEQPHPGSPLVEEIRLRLGRALLPQARFAEVAALAQAGKQTAPPSQQAAIELLWGAALSLEGSDLAGAHSHLLAAETLHAAHPPGSSLLLAQIEFELGSVSAQQGELNQAVDYYRRSLQAAQSSREPGSDEQTILAYNNLGYHLLLSGDPQAGEMLAAGLALAHETGNIGLQTYLLSTQGEIALAGEEHERAEKSFREGLRIASRLMLPERVAGLTANLGLLALKRGEMTLAIHHLSTALGLAETAGTHHLAAQIRVWLAPLLPPAERRARLAEARAFAEATGRMRLLAEIEALGSSPSA